VAEQDDELELKKRARRRLVGAVALVVLAVALLPLVMDEEAPPVARDLAIRIPATSEPRPQALNSVPAPAELKRAPAEQAGPLPDAAKPVAEVPPAPRPAEEKASAPPPPAVPPKTAEPAAPPAAPAGGGSADAQRAQAILGGRSDEVQYVLLIGAYANAANVTALTGRLADLGIKTYTETVDMPQGRRTRVRAGPFATRDAAEQALERMKRIGVAGQIAVRP
jgi:DedD protein